MTTKSLFPSIHPSLMLDFANSKVLDPRITFTRTTTARYYDGKTVTKAEENLLLRSQDYSATWTVTSLTPVTGKTAPDGTSTATEMTASGANAVLTQGFTAIAGSYTFSVWLRRVAGTGNIDIAADNGTWTTQTITSSWARYNVTQTVAAGSKTAGIRVVTSGDAIEVWGAQLEQRSSVTAYTATTTQAITNYIPTLQTAAAGQARFDHNPTTGESLGLLIEEQRTNSLTYSADFADAAWTKTASSITSNTIVAPDGTLTGDKLIDDTSVTRHQLITGSISFTSGTSYTISLFAKASELIGFSILRSGAGGASGRFNLSTLAFTNIAGSATGTMTSVGNGWYRCTMSWTASSSASRTHAITLENPAGIVDYTGNGYNGIFFWGAQLETGAFATSYIPTTTASATRNADAASMTGTNFSSWYRADEGTVYVEVRPKTLAATSGVTINNNSTSNRIRVTTNSTSDQSLITFDGTDQATLDGGTPAADTTMKLATAYKVNDFALSLNAGTVATDTGGNVPVVNQIQFGAETTTVGNVTLKKVAYYPTRCTNAQLQALTAA